MIIYVSGRLSIHSLQLKSEAEINTLRTFVEATLRNALDLPYDSDVEFEIDEKAGSGESADKSL